MCLSHMSTTPPLGIQPFLVWALTLSALFVQPTLLSVYLASTKDGSPYPCKKDLSASAYLAPIQLDGAY